MPVELPYDKPASDRDIDNELLRWHNEFSMRNGEFDQAGNDDAVGAAVKILDGDWEENSEFIEDVKDEFEELKSKKTLMNRFNLMHTTIGNLHIAEDIPENFVDELITVSTDYVNGFMPGQEFNSPEKVQLEVIDRDGTRGDYAFELDRLRVSPKPGIIRNGNSALVLGAHEVTHKNNVEAVIDDADTAREMTRIYNNSLSEIYQSIVEDTDVAQCMQPLLAGLALQRIEHQTGFRKAHTENRRDDINGLNYLDIYSDAIEEIQREYSLEEFDIRDESIAKAVTFFIEGTFEKDFKSELIDFKSAYNRNDRYSENAGDRIIENLVSIKEEYEGKDGLRGERFKSTMQNRIPFLKGEYEFGQ